MAINLGFYPAKSFSSGRMRWSGRQDIIVFHTTSGAAGLKEYEANKNKDPRFFTGSMGWFCHPTTTAQTSSHFITDRDGRYLQVVKLSDMAYCNGNNAMMRQDSRVKNIIKNRPDNANLYTYSIESEGTFGSIGDPPGTPEQFDAIVECMKICIDDMHKNGVTTFIPDNDHLIGHCHISPKQRYNCPAANYAEKYPFDKLIQIAKEYCDKKYPGWIKYPDTPIKPSTSINVGDKVQIVNGATWYGSKRKINSAYINGPIFVVDSLNDDRALLDRNGINSPIEVRYLRLVANSNNDVNQNIPNNTFSVDDMVMIAPGATWYGSTKPVPSWVIGNPYRIDNINGNKVLLDKNGINSNIDIKYLTKDHGEDDKIVVGSNVKIIPNAKWWGNTNPVPKWAIGNVYSVDNLDGNKALIGKTSICSYIDIKYLEKV